MDAGADICVTSIHKMGSGLEQGSVFHLRGDLVPPKLLGMRADLLGATSPSALIFAGLDGWRRQMVLRGHELVGGALELAAGVRAAIEEIGGMHVNDRDDFCGPGAAHGFGPPPVVIGLSGLGVPGFRAADWLRAERGVVAHVTDHRRTGAQLTHGDDRDTADELLAALKDLARAAPGLAGGPRVEVPPPSELRMPQARLPRDAFFGSTEDVPLERAAGRIAAEMVTPYPPGILAVLPGERLAEPVLRYLASGRDVPAGPQRPGPGDDQGRGGGRRRLRRRRRRLRADGRADGAEGRKGGGAEGRRAAGR